MLLSTIINLFCLVQEHIRLDLCNEVISSIIEEIEIRERERKQKRNGKTERIFKLFVDV